ncbi:adenylate/guanylate cyclase domain-containing protein [Roseibium sp. MMSF_3544]|uniref:adenylate/guanylate cyclase domain-containing protein n=1 Tax=unclassified Roseibium TaxID=2629323 RepID=UPI00273F38FF|nr:tetratricopeptide repeat protein [Roseibium sp. MMSF_3544]
MTPVLTAILYADAVGYSALIRGNETLGIRSIRHHLREITELIRKHGGERRGGAGDSVLATFPSARAAMLCALDIQKREHDRADLQDVRFRIGIHTGDAVEADGQLHGDSVNVAARLEPLAPPGGICTSESVFNALRGLSEVQFESLGRPELKNMGADLEVFRVAGLGDGAAPILMPTENGGESPISEAARPSVAVMPFTCLSAREDLAALADGFAAEVIGFLTRFRGLDVIAPSSSALGIAAQSTELMQRLKVRYTVDGRVQLTERRMRVKVHLYDAEQNKAIWTESYDRVFDDIFDIQEEIAECAAASMAVQIEEAERWLARARNPDSLDAYALQLRASSEIFLNERDTCEAGKQLIGKAINISPDYARSYAVLSRAHHLDWKYSWSKDPKKSFKEAHDAAVKATVIDGSDARGQAEVGSVALYRREHDRSLAAYKRALELNPSDADIIGEYADSLKHAGEKKKAIRLFDRAIRLNPLHADRYRRDLAHTHLVNRDFEAAIATVMEMTDPTQALRVLTASSAYLGRMEDAKHWAEVLRKKYPGFSARAWAHIVPDRDPADTEIFVEGLERAGL